MQYIGKNEHKKISEIFDKEKYTERKCVEWFIKENTYSNHLLPDIRYVNFNKYNEGGEMRLLPLTPAFCDNIMLFTIVPAEQIEKINKLNMYKKEYCSMSNTLIRTVFKDHNIKLAGQSVKCKKSIKYYADTKENEGYVAQTRQAVRELYNIQTIEQKYKTHFNKENLINAYIVSYKVELADEEINQLHDKLRSVLNELEKVNNLFFLLDFDITRDYYNSADYKILKEHVKKYLNIVEEKNKETNTSFKIVENNKNVGDNCITFNKYVDGRYVQRCKFYDKFICQVTSGGVTKVIGSNLYNYLYCPDKRLNATFADKRALNAGITRSEVTTGRLFTNNRRIKRNHRRCIYDRRCTDIL